MVLAMSRPSDCSCHSSVCALCPRSTPPSDLIIVLSCPPCNWGHRKAYIQLQWRWPWSFCSLAFGRITRFDKLNILSLLRFPYPPFVRATVVMYECCLGKFCGLHSVRRADYTASFPIVSWPWPRKSSSSPLSLSFSLSGSVIFYCFYPLVCFFFLFFISFHWSLVRPSFTDCLFFYYFIMSFSVESPYLSKIDPLR